MSEPGPLTIATWFVADDPGDATNAPQVGGDSSSERFQAVYWRCVCVFFLFSKRANPAANHVFFSNCDPPIVDGLPVGAFLERLGVTRVRLPITYRLPKGLVSAWGNQFYILDVIRYAIQNLAGSLVVLDSDCVWVDGEPSVATAIGRHGALTYRIDYAPERKINGTSRLDLKAFLASLGHTQADVPAYAGGELFAASVDFCRRAWPTVERVWAANLEAAGSGRFLREEAHFLSAVYALHGIEAGTANDLVKRLWTGRAGSNATPADVNLPIWHLPSEKKTGLRWFFERFVVGGEPLPDEGPAGRQWLAKHLGIPRRGAWKKLGDLLYLVRHRLGR